MPTPAEVREFLLKNKPEYLNGSPEQQAKNIQYFSDNWDSRGPSASGQEAIKEAKTRTGGTVYLDNEHNINKPEAPEELTVGSVTTDAINRARAYLREAIPRDPIKAAIYKFKAEHPNLPSTPRTEPTELDALHQPGIFDRVVDAASKAPVRLTIPSWTP